MASKRDRHEDELLSAYVDGVAELSPDERRAIEARMPELRGEADATRALIRSLRDLPPEGQEPVWAELAQRISAAVGPELRRPWWRRWTTMVPAFGTLALAAGAVLWLRFAPPSHRDVEPSRVPELAVAQHVEPVAQVPAPAAGDSPTALYLDGEAVELDDAQTAQLLDRLGRDTDSDSEVVGNALLSTPDLDWVDDLDSEGLAVAERWLGEHQRGGT